MAPLTALRTAPRLPILCSAHFASHVIHTKFTFLVAGLQEYSPATYHCIAPFSALRTSPRMSSTPSLTFWSLGYRSTRLPPIIA
ncbi:hypothetical protein J6590_081392 [Homalodisca vitripennis]|nr:hypothetical protein J6590_081392 [Homalodisca vitripennis]